MADISSVKINGTTYEIKDSVARGGGGGSNTYTYHTASLDAITTEIYVPANSVIWYYWYSIKGSSSSSGVSYFRISGIYSDSSRTTSGITVSAYVSLPVSSSTRCYLTIGTNGSGSATIRYYTIT